MTNETPTGPSTPPPSEWTPAQRKTLTWIAFATAVVVGVVGIWNAIPQGARDFISRQFDKTNSSVSTDIRAENKENMTPVPAPTPSSNTPAENLSYKIRPQTFVHGDSKQNLPLWKIETKMDAVAYITIEAIAYVGKPKALSIRPRATDTDDGCKEARKNNETGNDPERLTVTSNCTLFLKKGQHTFTVDVRADAPAPSNPPNEPTISGVIEIEYQK